MTSPARRIGIPIFIRRGRLVTNDSQMLVRHRVVKNGG